MAEIGEHGDDVGAVYEAVGVAVEDLKCFAQEVELWGGEGGGLVVGEIGG